jgi:catalase
LSSSQSICRASLSITTTATELARALSTPTSIPVSNCHGCPLFSKHTLRLTSQDTPNTLNKGFPLQANQTSGRGFFTTPGRIANGRLVRAQSPTFDDHWSQPRLFYNSLTPVEQQFLINAIRFETSHLKSTAVKQNVIAQLNRVSNDVAKRVATALGLEAPAPDPTYYHNNVTAGISIFNFTLPTIKTLRVGVLASTGANSSLQQASELKQRLMQDGLVVTVVGETLAAGVDQTYSAADATGFDGVVVADGAEGLFEGAGAASPLFPAGRPAQVLLDAYRWGKPIGGLGSGEKALKSAGVPTGKNAAGVFVQKVGNVSVEAFVKGFEEGLARFRVSVLSLLAVYCSPWLGVG